MNQSCTQTWGHFRRSIISILQVGVAQRRLVMGNDTRKQTLTATVTDTKVFDTVRENRPVCTRVDDAIDKQ